MATSPSGNGHDAAEAALFSDEEAALVRSVERSRVWKLLRDALCYEREKRFQELGESNETSLVLKKAGAIELIQWLLQEGPRFVVWYRRYMDAQEDTTVRERARKRLVETEEAASLAERVYDPSLQSPPDPDPIG